MEERTSTRFMILFCAVLAGAIIGLLVLHAVLTGDETEVAQEAQIVAEEDLEEPAAVAATEKSTTAPLSAYQVLLNENADFFAWLTIPGTDVDYPVMYTPDEPEKYLHLDFYGNENTEGLPFIDARCSVSPDSDNLIVYGHNRGNGTMFDSLPAYEDADYFAEHPYIRLNLPGEERVYEIFAAFYDRVYEQGEETFKFYNFIDAESEVEYAYAIGQFKGKTAYETGVVPEYGDHLLTLVTCTDQAGNGRFVVLARKASL